MELRPLKVNIPKNEKIDFQVKCTQNDIDMTTIIRKFISLYLSDNEALMPLLSD